MSKLKNFITDKIIVPMPKEQEELLLKERSQRICRYDKLFLYIIIAIELYNLLYALVYTGWRSSPILSLCTRCYLTFLRQ